MVQCGHTRSRPRSSKRRHINTAQSCWRNPCVVFLLTFVVLGSLRFRDDPSSRSKPAAVTQLLLKQYRNHHRQQQRTAAREDNDDDIMNTIVYQKVEEGRESGRSFQKFRAMAAASSRSGKNRDEGGELQPVSVHQWATTVAAASTTTVAGASSCITKLNEIIQKVPYKAVFFETPPVLSAATAKTQPFEFVLVDAPHLHRAASQHPDPHAFSEQLESATSGGSGGAVFQNLGGDATLIAPTIAANHDNNDLTVYAHLANFIRHGPPDQIGQVWKLAAKAYTQQLLSSKPVWFSTSGMGVYWLHFRLDSRPKYYTYTHYKKEPPATMTTKVGTS